MSDNKIVSGNDYKAVAVSKGLDLPDDETGLVLTKFEGSVFSEKKMTIKDMDDLAPTAEELDMINQMAVLPQKGTEWLMLRDVNPIGMRDEVDSQGDKFSRESEKDLIVQSLNTPFLMDHNHMIEDRPPVGMCIGSRLTPKGVRETIAVPKEEYNANVIKGLMNGTLNKISVGLLINPANKVCNSCMKSIYSYECPHNVGGMDQEGKRVSVTIKRVDRYLERSLVNVPARMNTSIKAMEFFADLADASTMTIDDARSELLALENLTSATMFNVNTIENSNLSLEDSNKEQDKRPLQPLERAQDEEEGKNHPADAGDGDASKYRDIKPAAAEAGEEKLEADGQTEASADSKADEASEDKAKKPADDNDDDDKGLVKEDLLASVAAAMSKAFEDHKAASEVPVMNDIKSVVAVQSDKVDKLLAVVEEQKAVMAKQSQMIERLIKLQEDCAETIKNAALISSAEILEKVLEIVSANKSVEVDSKKLKTSTEFNGAVFSQLFGQQ